MDSSGPDCHVRSHSTPARQTDAAHGAASCVVVWLIGFSASALLMRLLQPVDRRRDSFHPRLARSRQPLRLGDLARCIPKGERLILSRLKVAKMTHAQIAQAQRMAGE